MGAAPTKACWSIGDAANHLGLVDALRVYTLKRDGMTGVLFSGLAAVKAFVFCNLHRGW